MLLRPLAFLALTAMMIARVSAHESGAMHSHPHLLVSNEFLAAVLVAVAAGALLFARKMLLVQKSRDAKRKGDRR